MQLEEEQDDAGGTAVEVRLDRRGDRPDPRARSVPCGVVIAAAWIQRAASRARARCGRSSATEAGNVTTRTDSAHPTSALTIGPPARSRTTPGSHDPGVLSVQLYVAHSPSMISGTNACVSARSMKSCGTASAAVIVSRSASSVLTLAASTRRKNASGASSACFSSRYRPSRRSTTCGHAPRRHLGADAAELRAVRRRRRRRASRSTAAPPCRRPCGCCPGSRDRRCGAGRSRSGSR